MGREILWSADVEIEGITPMLMHKCGIIESGSASKADKDYSGEWKRGTYLSSNGDGCIIVPQLNLLAMVRDACKGQKIGRTAMNRVVVPGIDIPFEYFEVPVLYRGKKITLDMVETNNWLFTCAVVVQRNRVNRVRTQLPIGWTAQWRFDIFDRRVTEDILRNLLSDAGVYAGLCDWRPGAPKPGKFGMFEVKKFEVV